MATLHALVELPDSGRTIAVEGRPDQPIIQVILDRALEGAEVDTSLFRVQQGTRIVDNHTPMRDLDSPNVSPLKLMVRGPGGAQCGYCGTRVGTPHTCVKGVDTSATRLALVLTW